MDSDTARVMINRHLRAVALQTDYYVSFSDVFYDIRTLPQHKLQATLTQTVNTALGRSEHVSSFVENYPDIIGYYSIEHYGKAAVLPYVLQKLAKLDAQEGKDYIPTLSRHTRSTCTPIRSAADSSASAASPDWIWRIMTR